MLEHVVLYSYDRQIDLAAHATVLVWTALPGRLSNIRKELSFLGSLTSASLLAVNEAAQDVF